MKIDCKDKKEHECGKLSGDEDKEAKLKHLRECKEKLQAKIEEIDQAIKQLD